MTAKQVSEKEMLREPRQKEKNTKRSFPSRKTQAGNMAQPVSKEGEMQIL